MSSPSADDGEPGGRLAIELRGAAPGRAVHIGSTRPLLASRVFAGKPVRDAARQLPLLFSVCATAQAHACARACERALGIEADAALRHRRDRLLLAETVKEHLWRLLLDWPAALGQSAVTQAADGKALLARLLPAYRAARAALAERDPFLPERGTRPAPADGRARQAPVATLAEQVEQALFGQPAARWLAECAQAAGWIAWAERAKTPAAALARALRGAGLAELGQTGVMGLNDPDLAALAGELGGAAAESFIAAPTWDGQCRETTPFSRTRAQSLIASLSALHGNGLLPRYAALLAELASALGALRDPVPLPDARDQALAPGVGIASAPAARGLLVHWVAVEHGRIAGYRILAPTEWNFHPRGVVALGLMALPEREPGWLERAARLYILAIDPCVDYRLALS